MVILPALLLLGVGLALELGRQPTFAATSQTTLPRLVRSAMVQRLTARETVAGKADAALWRCDNFYDAAHGPPDNSSRRSCRGGWAVGFGVDVRVSTFQTRVRWLVHQLRAMPQAEIVTR